VERFVLKRNNINSEANSDKTKIEFHSNCTERHSIKIVGIYLPAPINMRLFAWRAPSELTLIVAARIAGASRNSRQRATERTGASSRKPVRFRLPDGDQTELFRC
jgi:hypothetical protein